MSSFVTLSQLEQSLSGHEAPIRMADQQALRNHLSLPSDAGLIDIHSMPASSMGAGNSNSGLHAYIAILTEPSRQLPESRFFTTTPGCLFITIKMHNDEILVTINSNKQYML